jgi:hypothetical protein
MGWSAKAMQEVEAKKNVLQNVLQNWREIISQIISTFFTFAPKLIYSNACSR